jgi:hypothetical protein
MKSDRIMKKLEDNLTSQEINNLFGSIVYNYEMMRFNGTPAMVKKVYGHKVNKRDDVYYIDPSHHDNYILEKTRKFFDIGSPFATRLDTRNIVRLGSVVREYFMK